MANFTAGGNYTNKLNQALSAPPAGTAMFFLALNFFLSITAALGNILILTALKNVSSIHPPTKLFFRCLAVTDLCISVIVQPIYAIGIIFQIMQMDATVSNYAYKVYGGSGYTLCGVSVLTSTAISVDRLLALLLGLRYRYVVTLRRVRVVLTCFWFLAISSAWLWVWRGDIAFKEGSAVLILCLLTSIFCYTRIHVKLRHQQSQVQNNVPHGQQNGEGIPLNIGRYKKTVSNIMWVQLALLACYIMWCIMAALYEDSIDHFVPWKAATTLVYLNSSLNPILYCWKIGEVRQAVKDTIKHIYCV